MGKLRILIADGHDVFRRGVRSLVEDREEWSVCGEAASGVETIEKTRMLCPDLLLLDITMPDLDAAKAIPRIIHLCPTVKIIALTTGDAAELAAEALAAGVSGLALKSEETCEILLTVQRIIKNRPFLSAGAVMMIRNQLARPRTTEPSLADLTPREVEILRSMAREPNNKAIAVALGISVKTLSAHRANIMRTLKLHTYSELVQFAIRRFGPETTSNE